MTALARTDLRRGACPGLSTPMQTGDGLLARLMASGTVTLDAMAGLAAAARRHGNGIIEITSRGSVQVRGLTPQSAPLFADAVAQLGIAAHDGVPVIADPLAGLDPYEVIDAGALAADLRTALAAQPFAPRLAPKTAITIDGGGALHLDELWADIRLRATGRPGDARLHVAIGGTGASAAPFAAIAPGDAIDTVVRLLGATAARGPHARVRDVICGTGGIAPAPARAAVDAVGWHRLRGDCVAVGIGLPFGHADVTALEKLTHAAREVGADGLRAAPGRALLVVGIADDAASQFAASASQLGFIVDATDPRRRVVACAGAPICGAGEIAARALAPAITTAIAPLLDPGEVIHLSGCAKGCAHQGAAALTVIGRTGACDLLVKGAPAGSCAAVELPQRLAELAQRLQPKVRHG